MLKRVVMSPRPTYWNGFFLYPKTPAIPAQMWCNSVEIKNQPCESFKGFQASSNRLCKHISSAQSTSSEAQVSPIAHATHSEGLGLDRPFSD